MIPFPASLREHIEKLQKAAEALRIVDFNEVKQQFFCRACRYRDPLGVDGNKLHDHNCPWVHYVRTFKGVLDLLASCSAELPTPSCVIGEYCQLHGFIHGAEAEELRERFEKLNDKRVNRILEDVDARDSAAFCEAKPQAERSTTTPELSKKLRFQERVLVSHHGVGPGTLGALEGLRDAADQLDALTGQLANLTAERDWQPISTAPKDTPILLWERSAQSATVGVWNDNYTENWHALVHGVAAPWSEQDPSPIFEATHWMPLPAPPSPPSVSVKA